VDVAIGILLDAEPPAVGITPRVLITQRREQTVYGGWWEFPGGKIEPGETPRRAVVRELYEEIGARATPVAELTCHTHTYDHATVRLHPLVCALAEGSPAPRAIEVERLEWIHPESLDRSRFLPANGPILESLSRWLAERVRTGDGGESA
jgi:mutator protein MutT